MTVPTRAERILHVGVALSMRKQEGFLAERPAVRNVTASRVTPSLRNRPIGCVGRYAVGESSGYPEGTLWVPAD